MKLDDLSKAQQRALIDLVCRGGMNRITAGWEAKRNAFHGHRTMLALERLGLCLINPLGACMGSAVATRAGRELVREDCEQTNKMIRDAGYG